MLLRNKNDRILRNNEIHFQILDEFLGSFEGKTKVPLKKLTNITD